MEEALNSDVHVEKLMIRRDAGGAAIQNLQRLAREREVPWQPVPLERLDRLTNAAHQGVIAWISAVATQDLDEVVQQAYDRGEDPLLIALDNVTDTRNMGAIARSAECFGAHGLLVPKQHSARLGSDAIKSSAGALLRKPVCRVMDLRAGIVRARSHGLRVIACTEKSDTALSSLDLGGPLVLVMGAEDIGISDVSPCRVPSDHSTSVSRRASPCTRSSGRSRVDHAVDGRAFSRTTSEKGTPRTRLSAQAR